MDYSSLVILAFGHWCIVNAEHLTERSRDNLPIVLDSEKNETNTVAVSKENAGLTSHHLSELHNLSKNISHSKGIYRETHKDPASHDEPELRRSMLNKIAVASDSDTIMAILERFHSDENKLQLLEQLEYLVHQYDVAVNFASSGGIEMIKPLLFSSDDEIVSSVASVLGSAMQSNPTVQKLALKHDIGANLFKLLSHKSPLVLSRIIFAFGSFLRNAPEAQEEFLSDNGVSKFVDILTNQQITANIKLKIINLFNDFAVEQKTVESYPNGWSSDRIANFKRLFAHEVQNRDLCKIIPSFLNLEDFDTHQKTVDAMMSLYDVCYKDFKDVAINDRLKKLCKIYDPESYGKDPFYPNIDKDLSQVLYHEITALVKRNNDENPLKPDTEFSLKMEL